jgi:multicomponent Na+:H+ antiporter subunit E
VRGGARAQAVLLASLRRGAAFAVLWWALSDGDFSSPALVVAVIAAATATSVALVPPIARWRLPALLRFAAFFVRQSVLGGVDVARRAMHLRRPPLAPELVARELKLQSDASRVFYAGCVSLLPGTLTVKLRGAHLAIHVIDVRLPYERTLDALERRIALLFGEDSV